MKEIKLLKVELNFGVQSFFLGKLALKDHRIWFEYDQDFLSRGLEISPYGLPLKPGAVLSQVKVFDGLFGVFNDSLPDAWGRLLLDRSLRSQGLVPESFTVLDRLACVGSQGMGALNYEPETFHYGFASELDLDKLALNAKLVLEASPEAVIDELLALNASSSGARPKVITNEWLIKFPSSHDPEDIALIEYAYSLMARDAGVEMPETKIIKSKKNPGFFAIQRFDRVGCKRLHMHTASGLLEVDHRYPSLDYDNLLRLTRDLTKDQREVTKVFRLAVFNVFAHNRDDHSKNFSFLMDETGLWKFSPAYDLTFSYGPGGEHSMMVSGEGKNPGLIELMKLADSFDIKNPHEIIDQVRTAISKWNSLAQGLGLSKESFTLIKSKI